MAKQITVTVVDDLDGSPGARTVDFSFDGKTYQIDLSADHLQGMSDFLNDFIAAARTLPPIAPSKRHVKQSTSSARTDEDRERTQAMRMWGRDNNYAVSDRGRIPHAVAEAYEAAHAGLTHTS